MLSLALEIVQKSYTFGSYGGSKFEYTV